jgi:hypothetical protein
VAGTRQLRAALEVLKIAPDPPENQTRAAEVMKPEDDEHTTAASFLASLKEWSLGINSSAEVSFVDHDGELGEKELAFRAGG